MLPVLLVSILPGVLWVLYFYKKDLYEPEPKNLIFKVFIGGMLMVFPAGYFESFGREGLMAARNTGDIILLFIYSVFLIGLIEEGLKFLLLGLALRPYEELDEPVDGIIYGVTVGLGFAALENLLYTQAFGYGVGLWRAVITSLAHASFTGWGARFLTAPRFKHHPLRFVFGWGVAVLLHGFYDFLIFLEIPYLSWIASILTGLLVYLLLKQIRRLVLASPFRLEKG